MLRQLGRVLNRVGRAGSTSTCALVAGIVAATFIALAAASGGSGQAGAVATGAGPHEDQNSQVTLIVSPSPTAGQPVTFTYSLGNITVPLVDKIFWQFDDGSLVLQIPATAPVQHVFSSSGTYNISMIGRDGVGNTYSGSTSIRVAAASPSATPSATPNATTVSGGAAPAAGAALTGAQGVSVSSAAGWNIVAGPTGAVVAGTAGALYTLQSGDAAYEILPAGSALKGGVGYWAFFPTAATWNLAPSGTGPVTIPLPAGQFVMVGNPGTTATTVTGADSVLVFDPRSNGYAQASQLQPGQGAWAVSSAGGQASVTGTR